jgi:hypothetical protein
MSLLPVGIGSSGSYEIAKSLRFRASASARLERTFATPTSTTIWTWSAWVKRGALGGTQRLFGASTTTFLTFNTSDQINLTLNGTSAATSTAVFRDPSAWYHVVYQQNGSAQTIWVNNQSVATGTTAASIFNTAIAHQIGAANTSNYFDGHLSEINFIDGQALTPSSFGFTDANGVWQPLKYTGTYGTNGFYLPFNDGTSLGNLCLDRSGNANNWTATNVSLTAGATYDWMDDTPTNNFAVLNPLSLVSPTTLTTANLGFFTGTTGNGGAIATLPVPTSGKWYFEITGTVNTATAFGYFGITPHPFATAYYYIANGNKYEGQLGVGGTASAYGATYTDNDVIGVAVDRDAATLTFYKNNVSQGVAFSSLPAIDLFATVADGTGGSGVTGNLNFGQRPFAYTPPTGFLPLCTKNLTNTTVTASGSFTGNANANGPFVWLNGVPTAMTINGNAVTFATHADRLANGFKIRTSSASYNVSGTNNYTITTTGAAFKNARAQVNP